MDAGSGQVCHVDAASVPQHPMALVEEGSPALHMMQNAEVQHRVKTSVRKGAEIVRAALDKAGIRQVPFAGQGQLLRHDVQPCIAARLLRRDQ